MESLLSNPAFRADYEKLKEVRLNPARHSAANAYDHCEMVAHRVSQLAALNGCSQPDAEVLNNLAYAHDIGKIQGSANPAKSVELLPRYNISDEAFVELVKYHDINLPWYLASEL